MFKRSISVLLGLCVALLTIGVGPSAAAPAPTIRWKLEGRVNKTGVNDLDCPTTHLCVAAAYQDVAVTTNPIGPARNWKSYKIDTTSAPNGGQSELTSVACVSASACVSGDDSQNGFFSASPDSLSWSPFAFPSDEYVTIEGIGCSPLGNCTALSVDGREMSTPHLSAGGTYSFVSLPHTNPNNVNSSSPAQISCPDATCVIAWSAPGVWVTTNAGSAFTYVRIPHSSAINEVDCVSSSLCIAGQEDGGGNNLWVSHAPSRAGSWVPIAAFNKAAPDAVACPSTGLCLAIVGDDTYVSTHPTVARTWTKEAVKGSYAGVGFALSCPDAHECVDSDQFGDVSVATF